MITFLLIWAIVAALYLYYLMNGVTSGRGNVVDVIIAAPILLLLVVLIGRRNENGEWEIDLNDLNRRDR
jgi:hypothetical protein